MSLILRKPVYPAKPISSIKALAATLRVSEQELASIANAANTLYRPVKPKPGSTRQTFDARLPLKPLHARIKSVILSRVVFPDYLTGSLKGRDYKTNASLHTNKAVIISEDVKGFFGSVSGDLVYDVWHDFFGFNASVARVLTQLTTKDGALPQGGIPSSYLANLALWRDEAVMHAKLTERGVTYSRYVDDMCMSSSQRLNSVSKKKIIAMVYGMLRKNGLYARRDKHNITPATKQMIATQLVVNRKAALRPERRANVRVAVFQAERAVSEHIDAIAACTALDKAANKVGQLGRFHPNLAAPLRKRIRHARGKLPSQVGLSVLTGSDNLANYGDPTSP